LNHTLGPRLLHLSSFYTHEQEIWDIGCDHGYLGLSFLCLETVSSVYLVDPSKKVIDQLINKLKDSYITIPNKIKVLNQKGQYLEISKNIKKIIFIAGMGGKEIIDILDHMKPQLSVEDSVIISPHKNILELRKYLLESEFRLKDESVISESGRFYQVLCLSLFSGHPKVSAFGEKLWSGSLGNSYRDYILSTFSSHQDQLSMEFVHYLRHLSY
jgi:tRNA (adenine22-N1)-methyltransferase